MAEETAKTPDITDMDRRQVELYAQDLQQLYWSERQTRAALAEEKLVLDYKVHELTALNKLFQANLQDQRQLREAYRLAVDGLKQLAAKTDPEELSSGLRKLLQQLQANQPAASD